MMIEVLIFSAAVSSALSTTTREAPWTPDPDCPFPTDDEYFYFPVPGDCTRYIECYLGNKYEYQCSDGMWWHQEILACDYPGAYCDPTTVTPSLPPNTTTTYSTSTPVNFTGTITTRPPITNTTTQLPTTTQRPEPGPDPRCSDDSTSYWPHPVFCHWYIECYMGNSYEMSCPPGLYFSGNKTQCVSREESECCETSTTC